MWQEPIRLPSPDGRWTAAIDELHELAMSAPTRGTLRVGEQSIEDCNPSMVWSKDSRYLAVPKWIWQGRDGPKQRVIIVCPERGWIRYAPGTYVLVELERFAQGIVHGINSPFFEPRPLCLDVRIVLGLPE